MPGNPPPFDNETDGLLLYLVQQRDGLRFAAYGLTEEQLRLRATPASALTVVPVSSRCWNTALCAGRTASWPVAASRSNATSLSVV